MALGTGILLGAIIVAVVILYTQTKDRWNWRKVVLRSVFSVVGLVAVTGSGIWGYQAYENRLVKTTEFIGVKLGDRASDVKFKRGEPNETKGSVWTYDIPDDKGWQYVSLKDNVVGLVFYTGDCLYCNRLFGLGIGSTYSDVIERLGEPTLIKPSEDQLARLVYFRNWNLVFSFKTNKVRAFGIYNPELGENLTYD